MVFRTSRYLSLHTQFQLNSSKCTGVRLQNQGAWENRFSPVKSMLQSSTIHSAKLLVCQMPWQRHASWAMPFALQISTLDDRLPVAMQRWCLVFMDVYGTCDICPAEQRCCIMLLCLASKACDGHGSNGSNQRNHNAFLLGWYHKHVQAELLLVSSWWAAFFLLKPQAVISGIFLQICSCQHKVMTSCLVAKQLSEMKAFGCTWLHHVCH